MGTSKSSIGPESGSPFDPPWLDDNQDRDPEESSRPGVAPPRRFLGARRQMGDFVRTGNRNSFRKAVGHYSQTGMGGAGSVASRMRASTSSATSLFNVLHSARIRTNPTVNQWVTALATRQLTAFEVSNEIIKFVAPNGGSADEASVRESMAQAMCDLIEEQPEIDLLKMEDDNIWTVIESFLGYEAYNRIVLDIGQAFENTALKPRKLVIRLNQMQDYIKAEISVRVEELREADQNPSPDQLQKLLQKAVKNTFAVYEGSL